MANTVTNKTRPSARRHAVQQDGQGVQHAHAKATAAVSALSMLLATPFVLAATPEVPPILQVPADNAVVWRAPATGAITYECVMTQTDGARPAWVAVKAEAVLADKASGKGGVYSSPPEKWKAADGSTLTGMEVVRVNTAPDRLYDQLVLANPSAGVGLLTGVTYIQRLVSAGGAAPQADRCTAASLKQRERVEYQAEYVFWKPQ